jgi:hypothetical protein
MRFEGDVKLQILDGALYIQNSLHTIKENVPFAYQLIDGEIHEIPCAFRIENDVVSFDVGDYNSAYDLVIDPEIAFSTYVGSTASNFGFTACDDGDGNLISGANVYAPGYPVTLGAYQIDYSGGGANLFDAAISKFDNTGSNLLYSTYLGGGKQDAPHSIVADSQNRFIVMGVTGSSNFPVTTGAYQTTFAGGPYLDMQSQQFFSGVQDDKIQCRRNTCRLHLCGRNGYRWVELCR